MDCGLWHSFCRAEIRDKAMNIQTIVIIGAGQAGASAILELRNNNYDGKIILIGDEPHLPYERSPLSKDMILRPEQTKIEILSQQKLEDLDVEFIKGNAVVKIVPEQYQVILESGEELIADYVATQLRSNGHYIRIKTWENANNQAGTFSHHVTQVEHP